jgi:hypothetical protein
MRRGDEEARRRARLFFASSPPRTLASQKFYPTPAIYTRQWICKINAMNGLTQERGGFILAIV